MTASQKDTIVGTGASESARAIAARLGESVERIRVLRETWQQFSKNGCVIALEIKRWRGESELSLADLGIVAPDAERAAVYDRVLKPGRRTILPQDVLDKADKVESKARYALKKRSSKTFWGRWLHEDRYEEWRDENARLQEDYYAVRDEINERWDELVEQSRRDYVILALEAFNKLVLENAPGVLERGADAFVSDYVARAMAPLIGREECSRRFSYSWESTYVATAAEVAADQAAAEDIRLNAAQRLMLEDIRRTETERARRGYRQLADDLIADVRSQVYDTVVDALAAIEKNDGRLPRNSSAGLKNLVELCSSTVFWSDPDLERRVANLQRIVETPAAKRSDDEVKRVLFDLGAEARLVLTELDRTPQRRKEADKARVEDELQDIVATATRSVRRLDDEGLELLDIAPTASRRGRRREAVAV